MPYALDLHDDAPTLPRATVRTYEYVHGDKLCEGSCPDPWLAARIADPRGRTSLRAILRLRGARLCRGREYPGRGWRVGLASDKLRMLRAGLWAFRSAR